MRGAAGQLTDQHPDNGRYRSLALSTVLLLMVSSLFSPSLAEDAAEQSHDEGGPHAGHDFHRNHFFGVVGWSHKNTGKDAFTFGMEYARVLTRHFGVGVWLEMSEGQFSADTAGISFAGYPVQRLALFAGPGVERTLFEEREYGLRVGVAYAFHPKGVVVAPTLFADLVAGKKIYTLGVAVGSTF